MLSKTIFIIFCLVFSRIYGKEPACSRFHYEEQTLEKMIRLEIRVEKMKDELDETRKHVVSALDDLKNERTKLNAEFDEMENENANNLAKYSTELKKIQEQSRRVVGQPVAFQAVGKQNKYHLNVHQPILFETVFTNIGTAFHVNNGSFIAPVHGVYLFSVSAPSVGEAAHRVIATELVKEGTVLAKTYSKSDTDYVDQGSVTVVTELQSGNEVWVRLNHPDDTSLSGGYSSFTGVLVPIVTYIIK